MRAWYIDALDALGGRAFASYRERDAGLEVETGAMFIGPPSFVAEPVSRATGLAATRGSFQYGFYIAEREYAFQEVTHVADFVRRLYTGGAGGDAGGGAPALPPSPPDRPDGRGEQLGPLPRMPDGEEFDASAELVRVINEFAAASTIQEASTSDGAGNALEFRWHDRLAVPTNATRFGDPLVPAAAQLLVELVNTTPRHDDQYPLWLRSVGALLLAIEHLDLDIAEIYQRAVAIAPNTKHSDWPLHMPSSWYRYVRYWRGPVEPFELLRTLPLPVRIRQTVEGRAGGAALMGETTSVRSVAALLAFCASAPRVVSGTDLDIADLVLLGAALVTSTDLNDLYVSSPGGSAWRARMERSYRWCAESLPRFALPSILEDEIERAPRLRYRHSEEPPVADMGTAF